MNVAGVDGCHGGWIVVYGTAIGDLHAEMVENIQGILELQKSKEIKTIAIDIPIGLPSEGERSVDRQAKNILQKRASSVFMAPILRLIKYKKYYNYKEPSDFKDVCKQSQNLSGKKISKQVFCLFNKLLDVNDHIEKIRKSEIKEFHPELCWPPEKVTCSKKTKRGYEVRRDVLADFIGCKGEDLDKMIENVRRGRCKQIARDDVIDALCGFVMAKKIDESCFCVLKESENSPSSEIFYFVQTPKDESNI